MRAVVRQVSDALDAHEASLGTRRRARREAYQATHSLTLSAVVCDLAHSALLGDRGIAITRAKRNLSSRSRYRAPAVNERLPGIMDALDATGFAVMEKGTQGRHGVGRQSVLRPGERLIEAVEAAGIEVDDIGRNGGGETIYLRNERSAPWMERGEALEYVDTPETHRLRMEMVTINERLALAELEFDEAAMGFEGTYVDCGKRWMRRIFTRETSPAGAG